MAFRFRLQALLRLKRSLEHQEEQRLLVVAADVARLRAEIERFGRARLEARRAASQELIAGSWGAVVQFAAACDVAAQGTEQRLRLQFAEAERRRLEQLRVYQEARQKREIFEGLRDQQEASYDREAAHREQERADDAFLARYRMDLVD